MNFQRNRFSLLLMLTVLVTLGFARWQQTTSSPSQAEDLSRVTTHKTSHEDIPITQALPKETQVTVESTPQTAERLLSIQTDVIDARIDLLGGDIIHLALKQFPDTRDASKSQEFVLLDKTDKRFYIAQSGLASNQGPDAPEQGRSLYTTQQLVNNLASNQDKLIVDLSAEPQAGLKITKRFTFKRGAYDIHVQYLIDNEMATPYVGQFYTRLKQKPPQEKKNAFLGVQTFRGMALFTEDKPYYKLNFKDVKTKPFKRTVDGGWAAMIEHYFLSAWILPPQHNIYQSNYLDVDTVIIEGLSPQLTVASLSRGEVGATLYAGPQVVEALEKLSPGLQLTVDYGLLWPLCQPIFWLLKKIFSLVGNWGVAIILVTVIIKGLFFKLSAASYRSMGKMRQLQPQIDNLKARLGGDQQKFGQAMLELYRKEKVNPLGGCLPLLVQIPVFIALYYVLLGSVELHNAPFVAWIQDLSSKDPYYILPILMGITMLAQQKLSPAPPDPTQAKVMMIMPVVFTGLFFQFPAGLVLYWVVNNLLSIAQQWVITQQIAADSNRHDK